MHSFGCFFFCFFFFTDHQGHISLPAKNLVATAKPVLGYYSRGSLRYVRISITTPCAQVPFPFPSSVIFFFFFFFALVIRRFIFFGIFRYLFTPFPSVFLLSIF